ncbi:Ubiquitin family protein [Phytophthora megakarya]|uniref:Ubiquitin family protein n=1 Tax=Phytophthora megakarya TaxID=4795 RepID=A0A225W0D4_9STRA|nr:Ubiquitin family protein [Phytophthora megakarya]
MPPSRAWTLLLVLAATALLVTFASADPREVENAELKEEFGDDFEDERTIPALGELEQHVKFELEHQMGADAPFTPRGVVEIVASASSPKPKVSFSALPTLSGDDVQQLETLLRKGRHYTVRAKADPTNPDSPYVVASVPMCMLAAMRLREDFAFHLSDNGKLVAIEYLTPYLDEDACVEHQTRSLKDVRFGPFGTVLKAQTGPSPPKNIVVKRDRAPQGVKPVKSEDGNDEPEEENQSFLRKYWYIILPIVVMSLFGNDAGAPPAGGAGGAPAPAAGGRRR